MRVVSTVHPASSVVRSVKLELDDGSLALIVAYADRIEAHALTESAVERTARMVLHARVLDMVALKGPRFLVTTDMPDPTALVLELRGDKLVLVCNRDLKARGARPAEFFTGAFATDDGEYAFSMHYKGKLHALRLDDRRGVLGRECFDCNLRELTVLSACVVPVESDLPVLTILHTDSDDKRRVTTRPVLLDESDVGERTEHLFTKVISDNTHTLVPLRNHGCILTMGGTSLRVYKVAHADVRLSPAHKKSRKRQSTTGKGKAAADEPAITEAAVSEPWPWGEIVAWTMVDDERILIGDAYGRLVLVTVSLNENAAFTISPVLLGQTSPATTFTYLDNGILYVGSHFGDSQLVRLSTAADASGSYISVVKAYSNLAPIVDAVIVDINDSNQPQVVTCSGGYNTGSLRVVQKSAELEQLAIIDAFPHTENIFPLRASSDAKEDTRMLVSSHMDTKFVNLEGEDLSVEESPFVTREPTLAASNFVHKDQVETPYVLQITTKRVVLVNTVVDMEIHSHEYPEGIMLASCSRTQALLALSDGALVYIRLENDNINATKGPKLEWTLRGQWSALCIEPADARGGPTDAVVIAKWDNTVQLRRMGALFRDDIAHATLQLASLACSVLLVDFGQGRENRHVLAGCANGTVVAARVTKDWNLEAPRTIGLGSLPVRLRRDGDRVVACGSLVTVLYWDSGRLQHSALAVKDITNAVPLHTPAFENTTVFISPGSLLIARVKQVQRLHIKTIPMGSENPRRIAYNSHAKAFGVGTMHSQPVGVGEPESVTSSFKILNQDTFDTLSSMQLDDNEEITSVASLPIMPESRTEMFVVGTAYIKDSEMEPSRGRILVFGSLEDSGTGGSWLTAFLQVTGAVLSLTSVDGLIVAGVNTAVILYELRRNTLSEAERASHLTLRQKKEWNHNYVVTSLAARGDTIYIGDSVASIAILRWKHETLHTIARHFGPIFPLALDVMSSGSVITANIDYNLHTFHQESPTDRKLEIDGSYHLGDQVNKFIPGRLSAPTVGASIVLEQVFVTSLGRIGIVAEADKDASWALSALERNIEKVLDQGAPKHDLWRAPHSEHGVSDAQRSAANFIDGDMLERFYDVAPDSKEYEHIMEGSSEFERISTTTTEKELHALLEQLQGLH
ncbi:hypothetical protein AURDEDRAFT_112250 [Auricularia subglabra TFB-10046 SS5]|nr:hypothetical protein AURDEDRAFT_112250 [Auricularia subglabra TFB-10046 SS5]